MTKWGVKLRYSVVKGFLIGMSVTILCGGTWGKHFSDCNRGYALELCTGLNSVLG